MVACKNVTIPSEYGAAAKSCRIYHPLLNDIVDLSSLSATKNGGKYFVVKGGQGFIKLLPGKNTIAAGDKVEYLIGTCQSQSEEALLQQHNGGIHCNGDICMKTSSKADGTRHVVSMGTIENGIYDFDHDELVVHYTNGDQCETHNGKTNYSAEIHFQCDQKMNEHSSGGNPQLLVVLPCHPIFTWRTRAVCEKTASINNSSLDDPASHGSLFGGMFLLLCAILVVVLLWNPHRRQKVTQATQSIIQRLFLRNSGRQDETNLLVTSSVTVPTFDDDITAMAANGGISFGRLSDEDDDEMIIA